MFKLSSASLGNLAGVDLRLRNIFTKAIETTSIDFGVIEGLRSLERQEKLVATGASQTLNSKHLTGKAVDLVAYVDGRVCWELNPYYEIAHAVRRAAWEEGLIIRWGGAWNTPDLAKSWPATTESLTRSYIESKVSQGKLTFIDAPHFEINE
jgi:peptidoglycan L-alanyl-D-glutamate endopeptidase CwlK